MKTLKFEFNMDLKLPQKVSCHSFNIKCIPREDMRQFIQNYSIDIYPKCHINKDYDNFKNGYYSGYIEDEHDCFGFKMSGLIHINGNAINDCKPHPLYYYQTDLTYMGEELKKLYLSINCNGLNKDEKALLFMKYLNNNFTYQSGVTFNNTNAEKAYCLHKGVCQDYSHILISMLRAEGIYARYVVGMICGEGASHAWVEYHNDNAWIGIDPTNNCLADEGYIKISHGRDYNDCIIDRGIFFGCSEQIQRVCVKVEEVVE